LCLFAALIFPVYGQIDRGLVKGTVTDPQNATVVGAKITLMNPATGATLDTTTEAGGTFTFVGLVAGQYKLTCESNGFKKFVQEAVQVDVGRTTSLNILLVPGTVYESVTVREEAPLLDAETSDVGTSVTRREIIGTQLLQDGHAADAAREFEAELILQPNSATVHVNLARALLLTGKETEAEKHLTAAIPLDRPPADALKLLAKVSLRRHHNREAITLLEQYTKSVPNDSSAHYLLARAYRSVENDRESEREMRKYQELSLDAKNRSAARQAIDRYGASNKIE
jgi:tetratricopeptide (TPR) repeat protein